MVIIMSEETIILLFFVFCLVLSFFKGANGKNETSDDLQKKNSRLEEEMEAYGLEEHEKELVRKNEYDVWDFDTEEPYEEDDYYGDDV